MNFETAMSQVAATMGISTEEIAKGSKEFDMLTAKAKEMGATTNFTASEAADGLNILAMAGLNAEESVAAIGDVLNLAGAGAISLADSASYLTGAVKGFNDEMENSGYYADLMAKGATMANTDVRGLGEALSTASSNANAYNQSAESTTVALLRLAEQNVTGAEAATAMSRAMADLYTPTSNAQKALEELGVSTYDANGQARDFNDVVDDLNGALAGYNDEQKLAYESTIFTTYGMKAFQKMTVSTAEKVKEFEDGLQKASGSAMQQYATQTDNLRGKMDILNSALEALGIEVYEVFAGTLVDSVGGATDAVDRLTKSVTEGELGDGLEDLGDAIGDVVGGLIDLAEDVLPIVIDGLSFLVKNLPAIIGGWVGLKAAQEGYTIATTAAKIAQEGLNAVMNANPIGLLISGIGMLVGALGGLALSYDDTSESMKEFEKTAEEVDQHVAEATRKVQEAKDAIAESENKASYLNSLKDELKQLQNLATKQKLTSDQRARAVEIVNTLNSELDGLNISIDEETGIVKESTEEWVKNTEARIDAAKQAVALEKLKDATNALAEKDYDLYTIEQELKDIESQKIALEEEHQKVLKDTTQSEYDRSNALAEYDNKLTELNKTEDAALKKQKEITGEYEETETKLKSLTDWVNAESEAVEGNTENVDENSASIEENNEAKKAAIAESEEFVKALEEEKEKLTDALVSEATAFDKVAEAAKVSKDDILKNLEENQQAMLEWSENMQTLAERGIDDGILQRLADMGLSGSGYVQAFVNMTGEELAQAQKLWAESITISAENANSIANEYMNAGTQCAQKWIDGMWVEVPQDPLNNIANQTVNNLMNSPDWERMPQVIKDKIISANQAVADDGSSEETGKQRAKEVVDGFVSETEARQGEIEEATKKTTDTVKTTMQTELESDGTHSQMAVKEGEAVGTGFAEGIKSKEGEVQINATGLATQAMTAIKNNASRSDAFNIGANIAAGMAQGIHDNTYKVVNEAKAMAIAAKEAAEKALDEHSPSKVFRKIGAFAVAGFNEGLNSMSVETTMGRNIQATLDNMMANAQPTNGGGDVVQNINVYSKAMTPDELAREIRLETKYGIKE